MDLDFKDFDKYQKLRLRTPIWGQGVKKTNIILTLTKADFHKK